MSGPDLRYPVGNFQCPANINSQDRAVFIHQIAEAPAGLRASISGLSESQLQTPYRPGGWTVRQVVHHVPDSHLNSYVRFKLAVTEPEPTIKPYDEAKWAELADSRTGPIGPSLQLLESLHVRWVRLLRSLSEAEWKRKFTHPERGLVRLDTTLG